MQAATLGQGLQRFALSDLPRERWRNGAGWTRPVASEEHDGQVEWRVSLAELVQAGAFSHFPGMDRTAVLAHGGPLHLHQLAPTPRQWILERAGDNARFPGENTLENLVPGVDTLVWNVMVRRGGAKAEVVTSTNRAVALTGDGHELVWVLQGCYALKSATGVEMAALGMGQGLYGCAGSHGASLVPATPNARLLFTRIR